MHVYQIWLQFQHNFGVISQITAKNMKKKKEFKPILAMFQAQNKGQQG